jgi:hypothetical protein
MHQPYSAPVSTFLFFFSLFFFSVPTLAYTPAEGNICALLGPSFSKTDFAGSNSGATSPVQRGWGLLVIGDVSEKGAIELGMLHGNKLYFRDQAGLYVSERTEFIQMNIGYRWWLANRFSFSTSFFSAYSMGDPILVHSDFPAGEAPQTSARDNTKYGLDFSIQTELYKIDRFGLILDTRYTWNAAPKENERGNHLGVLFALRYLVQESFPSK